MRAIALKVVSAATILAGVSSAVFAEQFTTDESLRWTVYVRDNEWWNDGVVTPGWSAGQLEATFPTYDPTGSGTNPDEDAGTVLNGTQLNGIGAIAVDNTAGSFFNPNAAWNDNATHYAGNLFGNLTNRALVAKYKIDIDQYSTGTALSNSDFYAGSYGHPGVYDTAGPLTDPSVFTNNPEEVRVSLYVRSNTLAAGDSAANESTRWFNEAQGDRMLFPFGPSNPGRLDNTTATLVAPFTDIDAWNNYWGYDSSGWSGPSGTAASNFALTIADIDQLRLQIDSSYYGLGGASLAPGLTGRLILDAFYTVAQGDANLDGVIDTADTLIVQANYGTGTSWQQGDFNGDNVVDSLDLAFVPAIPEPASLGLIGLAGLALLRRRSRA
jgi:hypothetical protein